MIKKLSILALVLLTMPLASSLHAAGDHDDFYEMKVNGENFWSILESLPYASEGQGPIMYVFEFSECPYCQKMYSDFGNKDVGIEFRRMFVPVSDRSGLETAALGKSRNIADYHAFMKGTKRAPQFNTDNDAIDPFNAIITGTKELTVILKQNEWPLKGFSYPQYAWMENGKVFSNAGYSKDSFSKAIARAKAGYVKSDGANKTMPVAKAAQKMPPLNDFPRRNPSLTELDIQGIRLGMSAEESYHILIKAGWTTQTTLEAVKRYSTLGIDYGKDKKYMKITFDIFADQSRSGISKIYYSQNFEKGTVLDAKKVRDSVVAKYGEPSNEAVLKNYRGDITQLHFKDYEDIPNHQKLLKMCQSELESKGMTSLQAAQKASRVVPKADAYGMSPPEYYTQYKDHCPSVGPIWEVATEAINSPYYMVNINPEGPALIIEAQWSKQRYEFNRKMMAEKQKAKQNRKVISDIDL